MANPGLLQILDRGQKIVAVATSELERQRSLLAQHIAEAPIPRELKEEARESAQRNNVAYRDNVLVAQLTERLRFGEQTPTAPGVVGNLERKVSPLAAHVED